MGKIKSVIEALNYLKEANGKEYSVDLINRIDKFIKLLPVAPMHVMVREGYTEYLIIDFDDSDGLHGLVALYENKEDNTIGCEVDIDFSRPHDLRAKSNEEAYALIKELAEVDKIDPYIYDPMFSYSDDNKYVNKCERLAREAETKRNVINFRLM